MEATIVTPRTPMRSVMVTFSPTDKKAKQFITTLKMMDFLHVEESPYNPQYVQEIKAMDKRTFKTVSREDLWK